MLRCSSATLRCFSGMLPSFAEKRVDSVETRTGALEEGNETGGGSSILCALERTFSSRCPRRAGDPLEHRQRRTDLSGGGGASASRRAAGVFSRGTAGPARRARLLASRPSDSLGPLGRVRGGDPRSGGAVLLQRRGGTGFLERRLPGADGAGLRQGERRPRAGDPRALPGPHGADPDGRPRDPLAQSLDVGGAGGL